MKWDTFLTAFFIMFQAVILTNKLNNMKNLIKFIEEGNRILFGGKSVCDKSFKMF